MKIKEFLKPDLGKIVVFIVILILANLPVVGYTTLQAFCEPCPPENPCPCPAVMYLNVASYPFLQSLSGHDLKMDSFTYGVPLWGIIHYLIWGPSTIYMNVFNILSLFLLLILNIAYWYLLSCLIVGIYTKLGKNIRKKF